MSDYCKIASTKAVGVLNKQLESIRKNAEALRAEEPDSIHDVRVASRRLRAVFSEYRPVFDKRPLKKARGVARQVTQSLGAARELDVSIALVDSFRRDLRGPAQNAAAHVLGELQQRRRTESPRVAKAAELVSSEELDALVAKVIEGAGRKPVCVVKEATKRTLKRYRSVQKAYAEWCKGGADSDLHALRIAFKKLRYACEAFASVYGRRMDEFIEALKKVQEELGEWHDYFSIRGYIVDSASSAPARATVGMPALAEAVEKGISKHLEAFTATSEEFFSKKQQRHFESILGRLRHVCKYKTKNAEESQG